MTRHRPDRRKGSRWPLWLMLAISSCSSGEASQLGHIKVAGSRG